jgi:hypothetical protein
VHDTKASIRRFLGESALEIGPFGLLGVDPRRCTGEIVELALQRQLDRVAAHPEGDTPEADEVRLALHAAAAQLLDPRVREHLCARWRGVAEKGPAPTDSRHDGEDSKAARTTRADHGPRTSRSDLHEEFGRRGSGDGAAKLIVGAAVVAVALIGLVIAGIIVLAPRTPPATAGPAAAAGTSAAAPAPGQNTTEQPADDTATDAALAAAASNASPIGQRMPSAPQAAERSSRTPFIDPRKSLKDLRDAAALARTKPADALAQLEPAIRNLSDWWAAYDPGLRRACDDAIVEAIYALAGSEEHQGELHTLIIEGSRGLDPSASGSPRPRLHADALWPAAWSVGMLTRLTRERELPTRLSARTSAALDAALGTGRPTLESTFESGAVAAIRRLSTLFLTDPTARAPDRDSAAGPDGSTAAAKRWIEACLSLSPDENAAERLLCDGLEQILLTAKEPDEDIGVFAAISLIAERIKWRAGGPARPRLMDWFRDSRISQADLRVVTASVASKSGAEGIDPTMVLSVASTPDDRTRLRARYAETWLIESAGGERASQQWLDSARAVIAMPRPKSTIDTLRDTAVHARLNEAARMLWRGEAAGAESLLREAEAVQELGPTATPKANPFPVHVLRPTGRRADGTWAERYFAAERSIPARLELLNELDQVGRPIGEVDAAILVQEAVIGSPMQVRYAAARLAGQWADEPAVVLSALDELPLAPRTRSTAEMMERITRQTLPPMTDPDWELVVRRALVERLLGMLAGGSPEASMEHHASLIADSYLRATGQEPARGAGAAAEGAKRGAELLWVMIRAEADAVAPVPAAPIPLDQIDRRRLGRRSLASGPVQAFAAEQVSIAEAMAFVVAGERPTAARQIDAVIARMQASRRAASHVFEQLIATEQAILELWLLRFDQESGGDA